MSKTEFFECACYSPEHVMHWKLDLDEPAILFLSFHLTPAVLWKRIMHAVMYIFGYTSQYGHFDEFLVQQQDCDKLIEILQKYKSVAGKYPTNADIDRMR